MVPVFVLGSRRAVLDPSAALGESTTYTATVKGGVTGVKDRAGKEGVTAEKIEQFFAELKAYADWVGQSASKDIAVLGEATDAAVSALKAVRGKVDDFFGRCRLAAFDGRVGVR